MNKNCPICKKRANILELYEWGLCGICYQQELEEIYQSDMSPKEQIKELKRIHDLDDEIVYHEIAICRKRGCKQLSNCTVKSLLENSLAAFDMPLCEQHYEEYCEKTKDNSGN